MTAHERHRFSRRGLLATALASGFGGLLRSMPLSDIKLGITTDEIDEDPAKAAEFLERFGLHYAEVRSVSGKYNTSQPVDSSGRHAKSSTRIRCGPPSSTPRFPRPDSGG